MNRKKTNIDEFFKEHFKNLDEPKRSKEREDRMLSEIIGYAREKGLVRKKPESFTQKVKEYFKNFNLFSVRYALPSLAILLAILIVIFSIFDSDNQTELNTNKNISEFNKDISQNDPDLSPSDSKKYDAEIEVTESETPNESDNIKEEITSDLALINYDFSTRSIGDSSSDKSKEIVELIADYFKNKNIDINYDGKRIITERFIKNKSETQVIFEFDKSNKDISLKVVQMSESTDNNAINKYSDSIKNDIEMIILENIFSNMAK
jgi:hypothetical protein